MRRKLSEYTEITTRTIDKGRIKKSVYFIYINDI